MAGIAQLVEPRIVIPVVEGSSPFVHPNSTTAIHPAPDKNVISFAEYCLFQVRQSNIFVT